MIFFERIKWTNFASYGDVAFEMDFRDAKTWAFTGKNGSGKSTLLDALSFALYGKPWRKVVKAKLVNIKNKRGLKVEVEFSAPSGHYKVVRGIKPDVFEIHRNGKLINQSASSRDYQRTLENEILGLSWDAFNQVVVIGKATYTPFMQLDTPKRRAFVESVLGLEVFSEMRKLHSSDSSEADRSLSSTRASLEASIPGIHQARENVERLQAFALDATHEKIEELKEGVAGVTAYLQDLATDKAREEEKLTTITERLEAERQTRIAEATAGVEVAKKHLDTVKTERAEIEERLGQAKSDEFLARSEINRIEREINGLDTRDTCPTCGAPIDASSVVNHKAELTERLDAAREAWQPLVSRITAINDEKARAHQKELDASTSWGEAIRAEREAHSWRIEGDPLWSAANADFQVIIQRIEEASRDQRELSKELETLESRRLNVDKMIADAQRVLTENCQKVTGLQEDVNALEYVNQAMQIVSAMLRDTGIKATIVRRYVPVINDIVNALLADMGFFAVFSLDESFEDKILSRGFEEMTYNSFSEGEKLRIDMAVLMAWRELCVLTGSSSTNLIIFDEILDGSFDQEGLDSFMTALTSRDDLHCICITHHVDRIEHFVEKHIRFEKIDGYSRFKESDE